MNTYLAECTRTRHAATAAVAMTLSILAFLPVGRADEPLGAEPKDQVLFKGTDFLVGDGADFHRLVGAHEDSIQIIREREIQEIESNSVKGIRVVRGEKLSDLSATISKLKERKIEAYDRSGGPSAVGSMASMGIEGVGGPTDNVPVSSSSDGSEAFFNRFKHRQDVQVSFEISAPRALSQAYAVVVTAYSKSRKDAPLLFKFSIRPLEQLGPKVQKVRIVQSGFPMGFELKGTDVKVYAEGREVATNLLKEQVSLSKDEAHEYFVKSYVSAHEGSTAPPVVLMLTPASVLSRQVDMTQIDNVVFVTVDAQGALQNVAVDESGKQEVTAQTASVMQDVRFMPALDNGVPVEGRLRVNLAELLE